MMLGDVPVIEIGDPGVEKDVEEKGKIEEREIETVIKVPDHVLNCPVNPENPERLHQEVEKQQQSEVRQEFSLHGYRIAEF